jgi:iron complex transport system substrate-binding protein
VRFPRILTALAIAAPLALGACADDKTPGTSPEPPSAAYPVTVGNLTLQMQPTRIVSMSPTTTEMLYAVGAGEQVIAVDELSNFPADVPKTDLSGFKPNAEAVAAKNPDLVVLTNDTNKIVDALAKLKVPVYMAPAAKVLDDTYRQIDEIGKLTGHASEAADVVQRMQDEIAKLTKDIKPRAKKLTYYHELDPFYYTVTSKTFLGSVYGLFGLENIADPADANGSAGGYPQLSAEAIVKASPDFVFLGDTRCCQQNAATVKARPGWSTISAVQQDRVVPLDDDIASRWGPRIVELVRAVADAVAKVPA